MKPYEKGKMKSEAWTCDGKRILFDLMNEQVCANDSPPSIVFIGDSITEMFEPAAWLPEYPFIINRGIGGDVAEGVRFRFDWDVVQLCPKVCVAMIGVNDFLKLDVIATDMLKKSGSYEVLFDGIPDYIESLLPCYREMAEKCKEAGIHLILCSVTPAPHSINVGRDYRNYFIDNLNAGIRAITNEYGFDYCDYTLDLKNEIGQFRSELAIDGLHPNSEGYRIMMKRLKPLLAKYLG